MVSLQCTRMLPVVDKGGQIVERFCQFCQIMVKGEENVRNHILQHKHTIIEGYSWSHDISDEELLRRCGFYEEKTSV